MVEKINNIKQLYTGSKSNFRLTLELLYTLYCFPGFIIHELSHILMIFLTLSFDKYTGHKWTFLEFFEDENGDEDGAENKDGVKKKGHLQSYGLTISFENDIHPISLFLIAASPIIAMICLYSVLLFSGLGFWNYFILSMVFFTSLKGLAPSDADYRSINISFRKSKAYYLKKKRTYFI